MRFQRGFESPAVYDPDGQRVKKTVNGVPTYYPFVDYEVRGGTATRYYNFGGQRIAMRQGTAPVTYLHGDHLGSTQVTTGGGNGWQRYFAYGHKRAGPGFN